MEYVLAVGVLYTLAAVYCLRKWRGRSKSAAKRGREPPGYLDETALVLGGVPWTVRDLCTGVMVLGCVGSGKTTGPLAALVDALLKLGGMLLITSKPDDRARYLTAAKRAGRLDDVVIIDDSDDSHSVNFLDAVLSGVRGDDATKAAVAQTAFAGFMETFDRGKSGGGEDNRFWTLASERLIRYAFHLMLFAGEKCSVGTLLRITQTLPATQEDISSDVWRAKATNQLLRAAFARRAGRESEYDELSAYFLTEMATLSGKTKSIIQATVAGVADAVSRGLAGRLLAGESTFDVAKAVEGGAVIIVDIPSEYGAVGRLVSVGVKVMVQAAVLRRRVTAASRVFATVIDEYQTVTTKGDWSYVSRCRSYRGPMIVATQGIESLRAELGEHSKDEIDTLASNLNTKIVALPTWSTATYICDTDPRK